MDILKQFTLKNLKLNKKRTIVTIIAIILSTALICCVAGMFTSFDKTMINAMIEQDGKYYVVVYGVDNNKIEQLKNNRKIEKIYLEKEGYTYQINNRFYTLKSLDDASFERFELFQGRKPLNDDEIVVNYNLRDYYNKTIDLNIDSGKIATDDVENTANKTCKVVGVLSEKHWIEGILTKIDDKITSYDVKIEYKDIQKTYKNTEEIFKGYSYDYNKELLTWNFVTNNNNAMKALISLVAIILIIIVVSSAFVIRNSFEISITEKMKQLGMLSSIGATKKQIRKSVLYEGFILGIIGIPAGILLGYIVIHILILFSNVMLGELMTGNSKFIVSVPLYAILLSILLGGVTILLSSLKSAHIAGKVSPIAAIRNNNDIKIKSKKLKTPKIINTLFGIGGVVAYKNLKRNKKKYRTTVISLIVSITIFISLYGFVSMISRASKLTYRNIYNNISIQINNSNCNHEIPLTKETINDYYLEEIKPANDVINKILKLDYISDYTILREYMVTLSKYNEDVYLYAFGDHMYKKILKDNHLNYEDVKDKIIYVENLYYRKGNKIIKPFDFKESDILTFKRFEKTFNLQVANINKSEKYDLQNINSGQGIFIISDSLFDEIADTSSRIPRELSIKSSNADKLEKSIYDLKIDADVYNYSKSARQINNIVLWISVFLYGFIIVISLIGVTNIFNTITTNMTLRSKEFAMLKSVGMTRKEFNRMIRLESIMYGTKSLIIGCILGTGLSYVIYVAIANTADFGYQLPITAIIISIIFITLVIGLIMKYSLSKINKQNIIETIRQDNI